jgi:hypothetical protein
MKLLYVENGVGRQLTKAFNVFTQHHGWHADFQHDVHPQMQDAQVDDVWWIEEVTAEGYAILTCDLAIVSTEIEAQAVRRVGARIVGFANAHYTKGGRCGTPRPQWSSGVEGLCRPDSPGGAHPVILVIA